MESGSGGLFPRRCAYCHEPFRFDGERVQALQAEGQYVCNDFCAQALREEAHHALGRVS